MKKSFFLAFLIMLFSLTLFGCKKENPTVDIVLESTHDTISYDLAFKNIKSDANRKYKIVLYTEGTRVVEDVNLLTEVSGEFKNLTYNTVYSVSVLISKKAKGTDFNIEIGNKSISTTLNEFKNISFENLNTVYDGKPKSIYVEGAPEGTNIEYTGNGVTDAGTHEVTAKLSKEGYKELTLKANIVIAKGTHSIKLNDVTKVYDGKPISVNLDTDLSITYEYYSGNTKLESAPSDVGEYTVKAIFAGDKNYEAFELSAKYTIKSADADIELKNKTVVYNGEAQELVADTTLDVTYEYYLNNEKLSSKPVNVGVYTVKAIFAGDKNHAAKTVEATLTITKADTSISVVSKDIQLDYGKTLDLNAEVSNGATPTIKYNTTDGKAPVNVGKYTATISYAGDNNYNAALDVVVNITIVQADIDLKFNSGTFTYDGEEKSLSIDTSLPITYEYYLGETKLTSLPVNAGVYKVKAIYAGDANHEAKTLEATLTINKASATIIPSVAVIDVVYGQDYEVTAELDNGVNVTPIYNTVDGKAPVNAGNYTATFKFEDSNYLPVDEVVVPITIRKVEVTIEVEEVEVTYDGKPHGVVPVLSNGATPSITYDTNDGETPVNAGTYFATIVYAGDENHKPCEAVGIVSILKADVTITVEPKEVNVTYDGKPHGVTATASNGATLIISYDSVDGNEPVNAGEYIATVICPENPNYNTPDTVFVDIIIEKATYDMSGITFEDLTVTYDGQVHEIIINGTLPTGVEVEYINNKGTSAGYYSATAKFTCDDPNFETIPSMTAKLTITKADVVITAEDKIVTYNGEYHTVSATVSHDVEITVTYKYIETGSYSEWLNGTAGTYEVTLFYKGDDNHNKAEKVVTMTIEKATPVITIENKNIVVDLYEEYDIEYSISNDLTAVLTYNTENGEKPVDAGTYTATISFAGNTNYNAVSEIINITIINPAYKNITVEVEDVEVSYGQSYKVNYKVTDSDGNVVDDYTEDQVRISVFNSTTLPINAGEYEVLVEVSARHDIFLNANSGKGSIVINKVDIDISGVVFEDKTVTYTGEEIYMEATNLPEGISYGCRYLINDQIAPNIVDAGIYKVELVLYNDREDSQNYNPIPIKVAYLTILKADTELFIPFDNYEIEYGTAILPLASVDNGDTDNLEIKYYNSNDEEVELPSAVGEYYAVIKYLGNKNYNAIDAQNVTLVIKALNYDFGFVGPFRKTYDGTPLTVKINQELDVEYKYYKINDWNEEVLLTGYPTNAGNYIVRVTVPAGNGYADYTIQQTLIIDYAETVLTVKFNGEVITEGQNVQVDYREDYEVTATVAHGDNKNIKITYNTEEGEKPDFASTFYGQVLYVGENYAEVRFHFTLTINQIEPVLIYDEIQTVIFNSSVQEVEFTCGYDDFYPNTVEYKVNDEWTLDVPMNVGSYEFRIHAGTENGNYIPTYFYGTFIILPQEVDLNISFDNKTVTYTGEVQTIEVTGNTEGLDITYEYRLNDEVVESAVNVGVYTVIAYIDVEYVNTADQQLTATLTIEEAEVSNDMYETSITVDYVAEMTVESIREDLEVMNLTAADYTTVLIEGENTIEVTFKIDNYKAKTYNLVVIVENEKSITVEDLGKQIKGKQFDITNIKVTYSDNIIEELVLSANEFTAEIKDGQDTNGTFSIIITYNDVKYEIENAVTPIEKPNLMIYAVYGGGGNSGATYKQDFIILYNDSNKEVDLSNYSIQYATKSGNSNGIASLYNLENVINPYGYYVIVGASSSNGIDLPENIIADKTITLNIGAKEFIVYLSHTQNPITVLGSENGNFVDFVAVSSSAIAFETQSISSLSNNNTYVVRKTVVDSDNNALDFRSVEFTGNYEEDFNYLLEGYIENEKLLVELSKINFEFLADDFKLPVNILGNEITWTVTGDTDYLSIDEDGNVDVTLDPNLLREVTITYTMIVGQTTYTDDFECQITKKLATPELNRDMFTISWDNVPNAKSYTIYINNNETIVDTIIATGEDTYTYDLYQYLQDSNFIDAAIWIVANPISDLLEESTSNTIDIVFADNNELEKNNSYIFNAYITYLQESNGNGYYTFAENVNGTTYNLKHSADIHAKFLIGDTFYIEGKYNLYNNINQIEVSNILRDGRYENVDVEENRVDLATEEEPVYGKLYYLSDLTKSIKDGTVYPSTTGDFNINLYVTQYYLPSEKRSIYNSIFDTEELLLTNVKGIYSNYSGTPQLIVTDFIVSDESYVALDMKAIADTKTVTEVFELTTNGKYGSNITWSVQSGEEYITIENNIVTSVTRPGSDAENDAKVVLLATFELNEVKNITKTVTITVTKMPEENEPEQPAEPVTVISDYSSLTNAEDVTTSTQIGFNSELFTFTFSKNSSSTNIKYYTDGNAIRIYGKTPTTGGSIEIKIAEGYTIKSIKLTFVNVSYNNAAVYVDGNQITDSDSSDNVSVFDINSTTLLIRNNNNGTTQVRIKSIEIIYV